MRSHNPVKVLDLNQMEKRLINSDIINIILTLKNPCAAARWSGVCPELSLASTFAPAALAIPDYEDKTRDYSFHHHPAFLFILLMFIYSTYRL